MYVYLLVSRFTPSFSCLFWIHPLPSSFCSFFPPLAFPVRIVVLNMRASFPACSIRSPFILSGYDYAPGACCLLVSAAHPPSFKSSPFVRRVHFPIPGLPHLPYLWGPSTARYLPFISPLVLRFATPFFALSPHSRLSFFHPLPPFTLPPMYLPFSHLVVLSIPHLSTSYLVSMFQPSPLPSLTSLLLLLLLLLLHPPCLLVLVIVLCLPSPPAQPPRTILRHVP
ncbi:hypothetical protein FB45DRAFT_432238 [Roridomyces roridus]|uniref:Uncharacterized protein n=1 Tax=Roridomyces roridus TaxID=1738132 RepID=A0AAD7B213_9AGAR|nr:hypothetical protein FB45DRAFT_432238 [Roridomyces roridus]